MPCHQDETLHLVDCIVESVTAARIRRLTRVYMTLSLDKLADMLGVDVPVAVDCITTMVCFFSLCIAFRPKSL